jgi:hypothetical protein
MFFPLSILIPIFIFSFLFSLPYIKHWKWEMQKKKKKENGRKSWRKGTLIRLRSRWKDTIRMGLLETVQNSFNWIYLTEEGLMAGSGEHCN